MAEISTTYYSPTISVALRRGLVVSERAKAIATRKLRTLSEVEEMIAQNERYCRGHWKRSKALHEEGSYRDSFISVLYALRYQRKAVALKAAMNWPDDGSGSELWVGTLADQEAELYEQYYRRMEAALGALTLPEIKWFPTNFGWRSEVRRGTWQGRVEKAGSDTLGDLWVSFLYDSIGRIPTIDAPQKFHSAEAAKNFVAARL